MDLSQITPIILTCNEEPNLERSLAGVAWAPHVLVVDSFSDDRTPSIAKRFSNVTLVQHTFESHAAQWEFARLHSSVHTEWVLALDADYIVTESFRRELEALSPPAELDAYGARFSFFIAGRPIRCSMYPPVRVLFRRDRCCYVQRGHTQVLQVDDKKTARLKNKVLHDDRKTLSRWLENQSRYAEVEVARLTSPNAKLRLSDRVRRGVFFMPWLALFYTLVLRLGIFDGWRGWVYAFQRMIAESILSLRLMERRVLAPEVKRRSPAVEKAA